MHISRAGVLRARCMLVSALHAVGGCLRLSHRVSALVKCTCRRAAALYSEIKRWGPQPHQVAVNSSCCYNAARGLV
jgi:hypothetical protein